MVTDLGEQPTPEIEPAEPAPGGVDAVEEALYEPKPLVPDLSRVGSEQSKEDIPEAVTEPDATDTAATQGESADTDRERPA